MDQLQKLVAVVLGGCVPSRIQPNLRFLEAVKLYASSYSVIRASI